MKTLDIIYNLIFYKSLLKKTREMKSLFKGFHIDDDIYLFKSIFYNYQIHDFYCSYKEGKIVLNIVLDRPGILIGKAGRNIDEIEKHLEIKINIIESKLWK